MDPELQRAKKIFERAIELDPAARAGYVRAACAEDAPLRERVERLLAEHDKEGDFLASRRRDSAVGRQRSLPQEIGHYRLLEKLGEGGMGEVWKAEDTQLRRTVALKFLSSQMVDNEEVKARLVREAQASASLDHPNICQVHGIHEEESETFIAMAYVDGPSLADKIKERPLPLDQALDTAIQIAEGLQEAHEKGIVHRDLKPANVMLTAKGRVKITDFGLASLAGRTKLTKSGTTLGTPAYMAPEQLEAEEVDRRADVWCCTRIAHNELGRKDRVRDGTIRMLQPGQKFLDGQFTHLTHGLAQRRKPDVLAHDDVVEANHGHVVGHFQARFFERAHGPVRR